MSDIYVTERQFHSTKVRRPSSICIPSKDTFLRILYLRCFASNLSVWSSISATSSGELRKKKRKSRKLQRRVSTNERMKTTSWIKRSPNTFQINYMRTVYAIPDLRLPKRRRPSRSSNSIKSCLETNQDL